MNTKLKSAFLCLFFTGIGLNAKIIFEADKKNTNLYELKIIDEIRLGDDIYFTKILEEIKSKGLILKLNAVQLNSGGGNLDAAYEIGKTLRANRLNTYISKNSVCHSACVFVLASGVIRMPFGSVGIHRSTYFGSDNLQINKKNMDIDDKLMGEYFYDMGISWALGDAIRMTPSWKIRILTEEEKINWGIKGTERIFEAEWFKKLEDETNLERQVIKKMTLKYSHRCSLDIVNMRETMWQCIERNIKSSALKHEQSSTYSSPYINSNNPTLQ